jgi:hypothetical protein
MPPENTTARLDDVFEELRDAIFVAYTALAERDRDHDLMIANRGSQRMSEQERRQSALNFIDEILDGHPLASFSAVHLDLLELMMAYWREAEVEVGAPSPDFPATHSSALH